MPTSSSSYSSSNGAFRKRDCGYLSCNCCCCWGASSSGDGSSSDQQQIPCCRPRDAAVRGLGWLYRKHGEFAARHPFVFIVLGVTLCAGCSVGFTRFVELTDTLKLWIPPRSEYRSNADWIYDNFPPAARRSSVILHSTKKDGNVLTGDGIRAAFKVRQAVADIRTENNHTWESTCLRGVYLEDYGQGDQDLVEFFGLKFPEEVCPLAEHATRFCVEQSLVEIWGGGGTVGDEDTAAVVRGLNDDRVLEGVNRKPAPRSGLSGMPVDVDGLIGSPRRDPDTGDVVSAGAMLINFIVRRTGRGDVGEDAADPATMEFESAFVEAVMALDLGEDFEAVPKAGRSFDDVSLSAVDEDLILLAPCYAIVIVFVALTTGSRLDSVRNRAALSLAGISAVVMGIVSSLGLCSFMGLPYTQMHSILPFMLLGIGIDDMFVIVHSFDAVSRSDYGDSDGEDLVRRFGLALRHAGMAITVTTVTDFVAFGIGVTTYLPALSSFCAYAAVGIVAVFTFMVTFFLGFMVLDQRRAESRRDAICCCFKKAEDWRPNQACGQKSLARAVFKKYSRILVK